MQNVIRYISVVIALGMLMLPCSVALADNAETQCSIQLNKTSVAVGETVEASVFFSGGFTPYQEVQYTWSASRHVDADMSISSGISWGTMQSGESVSCTPTWGEELTFDIYIIDALGQPWSFSRGILITGTTVDPVSCTIGLSKNEVAAGDSIDATVTYSGGAVPYREVQYTWSASRHVDADMSISNGISWGTMQSGESVSCTPTWGEELTFDIYVVDALGQPWLFSKSISITGTTVDPVNCTIGLSENEVAAGDLIDATVTYSGGAVPYREVQYTWAASRHVSADMSISNGISWGTMQSGESVSCTPTWGEELAFDIYIVDALGQPWRFGKTIRMTPSYIFTPGSQRTWQQGSGDGLCVTVDADYDMFLNIAVDGMVVDSTGYRKERGSTVITLLPLYLNSLSAGTHTLTAYFRTGYAEMQFVIYGVAFPAEAGGVDIPKTGDCSLPYLWQGLMLFAGVSLLIRRRRRRKSV